MDSSTSLINYISKEIYQELKTAVELGHWASGNVLSEVQKKISLQALIAYESKHVPEKERTAYIHKPEHEACATSHAHEQEQPVKFKM